MASGAGKRALFTLAAAVGVPLLLLLLLEGGLRLVGFGFDPDFFVSRTIDGGRVLTSNPRFGWRFFPPEVAREPNPFSIPERKPPGTARIFVLGGSAAMGDPAPASGMPRVLQAMLEACRPDLRIEVVNAAMTAINSHVVLPVARDCLERDADVMVVYLGNNEVVGPFGAGSVFGVPGAGWRVARAIVALKATRIGQLAERVARAVPRGGSDRPEAWKGMELFLGTRLPRDDPALAVVRGNLERNLRDLVAAADARGVPVVLSTVGVNVAACAPFGSEPVEDDPDWHRLMEESAAREAAADPVAAAAGYARGARMHPEHAEARYRLARALRAAGDTARAAPEYTEALDLDVLRFRADPGIQRAIRAAAAAAPAGAVTLVDGAAALAAAAPGGLPGAALFDDHVHPTFEGNVVLGREIAEAVLPLLPGPGSAAAAPAGRSGEEASASSPGDHPGEAIAPLPDRDAVATRIGYAPWCRLSTVQLMKGRRNLAPFTAQADRDEWATRIEAELQALVPGAQPAALRRAAASLREQVDAHPDDWMLRDDLADLLLRTDDVPGALRERRELVRRFPYLAGMRFGLGEALARAGLRADAMDAYREAIARDPRHFLARNRLGEELLDDGRPGDALPHLEAAVRAGPQLGIAHRNLGEALLKLGRPAEAEGALRRAIEVNPELAAAHKKLGDALEELGRLEEAGAAYREAVRLNPDYSAARERLARLERAGR
jgi:tetratricopeptide (TPR) repeat protein